LTGVTEVAGMREDFQLDLKDVFIFEPKGRDDNGRLLGDHKPTGYIPQCYHELVSMGIKLDKALFTKAS
jgi:pilus assembly protein CpaF